MEVKIKPWLTPNFVIYDLPTRNGSDPVIALDAETIAAQCDRFRADVFKKACKVDPALARLAAADRLAEAVRDELETGEKSALATALEAYTATKGGE